MRKRDILSIVALLLTLIVLIGIFGNMSFENTYNINKSFNELNVNKEKYDQTIGKTKNDNLIIKDIKFNNFALYYDEPSKTYFYSLVEGEENAYEPEIKFISNKEDLQYLIYGEINSNNIASSTPIKLIAYDDNSYNELQIICTTLPLLNITVDKQIEKDNEEACKIKLFDNRKDAKDREFVSDSTIHLRGGSSLDWYPKKGFKISLKEKASDQKLKNRKEELLGLRKDDDFILYGAYNDQEKIRNVFSTNLWYDSCAKNNDLDVINGNYYRYVELFINNQYCGLYALGSPLDAKQYGVTKNSKGELYKKDGWSSEKYVNQDNFPIEGFELKSDNGDSNEWEALRNYLKTIKNSNDIEELYDLVDIDNAIDMYLFINLIQGDDHVHDGGDSMKNYFMCAINDDDETKMLHTPWDMDITWGNIWVFDEFNLTKNYAIDCTVNYEPTFSVPYKLIELNDDEIKKLIKERYDELRNNEWSNENIIKVLDEYENQIFNSGAFIRDRLTWPEGTYIDSDIKLTKFKEYVINRLEYFDTYIKTK